MRFSAGNPSGCGVIGWGKDEMKARKRVESGADYRSETGELQAIIRKGDNRKWAWALNKAEKNAEARS